MSENIFAYLTEYMNRVFAEGIDLEVEQFVGLSESDYLQNTYSFISTFPLMKYEKYRFYFNETETTDYCPRTVAFACINHITYHFKLQLI